MIELLEVAVYRDAEPPGDELEEHEGGWELGDELPVPPVEPDVPELWPAPELSGPVVLEDPPVVGEPAAPSLVPDWLLEAGLPGPDPLVQEPPALDPELLEVLEPAPVVLEDDPGEVTAVVALPTPVPVASVVASLPAGAAAPSGVSAVTGSLLVSGLEVVACLRRCPAATG